MAFNKQQLFLQKVHFSGRVIGESEIYPDPKLLQSIAEFPIPHNISGVQTFFRLVEQVSFYFSKCDTMEPFRHLLKRKLPFLWTQELDNMFLQARLSILEEAKHGISIFDLKLPTTLQTD